MPSLHPRPAEPLSSGNSGSVGSGRFEARTKPSALPPTFASVLMNTLFTARILNLNGLIPSDCVYLYRTLFPVSIYFSRGPS